MRIKTAVCTAGVAVLLSLTAVGTAGAAGDQDCSDFATPVIISHFYDPDHLDADGDGIGCEGNAGDAIVYDRYSQLSDEGDSAPQPSLAATGAGDLIHTHPVRSIGAAGLTIGAGVVTVLVVRRRTTKGN